MINLFCSELPETYVYDGRDYAVNTDFRYWIKFELLMTDKDISARTKHDALRRIVFPVVPPDPELWEFIIWFYSCGKTPTKPAKNKGKSKKQADVYSFEYDDGYIFAAFMEQYSMDLTEIGYLHWWKFRAMFKALHDCKFTDIMGYRAEEITSDTPEYRKKFLNEMKSIYALPRSLSEQMKIDELKRIRDSYK